MIHNSDVDRAPVMPVTSGGEVDTCTVCQLMTESRDMNKVDAVVDSSLEGILCGVLIAQNELKPESILCVRHNRSLSIMSDKLRETHRERAPS